MLKLGSKLDIPKYGNPGFVSPPSPTVIYEALYEDDFINTFASRQVYSSRIDNTVTYTGDGGLTITSPTQTAGFLVNFDCLKDQYPTYTTTTSYGIGAIVYGGYYGHALFQRTGAPGPSSPPIISHVGGTQDANGWTRYRPTTAGRLVRDGDGVYIVFYLRLNGPAGAQALFANNLRFGLFDSNVGSEDLPKLINADNYGGSNNLFGGYASGIGYRGYMMTTSGNPSNVQSNWIRTGISSTNLMNSTALYTQVQVGSQQAAGVVVGGDYEVGLQVERSGNSVLFSSAINGPSYSTFLTYEDTNPSTYNFDVLAANIIANTSASFRITSMVSEKYKRGFTY